MNIWQFQSKLTKRLMIWSLLSIMVGGLMQASRTRFLRGFGQQFAVWGFIDGLIAIFGNRSAKRRYTQYPDPLASDIAAGERHKLRKILWINTGLDVGYLAGGTALALTKGKTDSGWRGHGIGVVLQGGFLFFFDLFHVRKLSA